MKSFHQKIAVVTGAASGIGRQLGIQLAEAGAQVVLADINLPLLEETARLIHACGGQASTHCVDVSKRQQVESLAKTVIKNYGQVDILINNAGVALELLSVEAVQYEEMEWLLNINLWGVIYGTKAFLPYLKDRPEAAIVNISSVFGFSGIPMQAAYVTSKFGIRGFTETLQSEWLDRKNLHIMLVHPGGIKTSIARNARKRLKKEEVMDRSDVMFEINARTTAEEAARQIIRGLCRRKSRLLIGRDAWWMDRIVRLFPGMALKIFARIAMRINQGKKPF